MEPDWNSQWDGLDPAQADGRECVSCGDLFTNSEVKHPVGQSYKDYEVFACEDCLPTVQRIHNDWEAAKSRNRPRSSGEATG